MKKKSMRILSLIVAIIMVVSIIPLAALAEQATPTRKVGVVVYGAEMTALLTDLEKNMAALQEGVADLQEGNANIQDGADKAKSALERLQALATDIGTKVADGSGISVPDVDVVIIDENGKETKLKEDKTIELFTETTEIYLPFQTDVEAAVVEMKRQLDALKVIIDNRIDALGDVPVVGGALAATLRNTTRTMSEAGDSFTGILNNLETLSTDIVGNLASLTGLNGALYRTYVTEDAVPVGKYTVKVKNFYDTDADGNAITRDGYILYNDGLTEGGSGFNTYRTFKVDIVKQDTNNPLSHEIQFVGPKNGIVGTFELPTALNRVYTTLAGTLNRLTTSLGEISDDFTDGRIVEFLAQIANAQDLLEWFKDWNIEKFQLPALDLNYEFTFPGLWCAESDAGFAFTNVDVAETGIAGDTFLLVNRQETIDVLKLMLDLGKEVFTGILKATFGYTNEETGEQYESMLTLYTQLVKTDEEGQLSLDYDVAYNIIKNYIAVISDMEIMDKIVDTDTGDLLTPVKLRYPIPAILQAVSDENGKVEFTKNSNITLTWMLDIIPQVTEALSKQDLIKDNQVLNLLLEVADYAADLIDEYGSKIINTLVYPFAQRFGLVGKKMASGEYIMFQTKTADDYWVNPLAYTMILTWENDTWLYVTVADLGIIVPYFAEGWYDFVRNTTFAGTIDKFLSTLTGKEVSPITDILTDKIDITEEMGKVVTASLTAFVGTLGFDSLGLDTIFASRSEFIEGLNNYLYENGRTAQNLMIYVNRQAQRAKSVYAGYVTADWYFYNLDKSPTLTATKLIDKSTKDISAAFVNPTASSIINRVGSGVSSVVSRIGNGIESVVNSIKTQIKSTIGAAIQSVIQNVVDAAKNAVTGFFQNLFNRGAVTFNA